jgi:TonB family protein
LKKIFIQSDGKPLGPSSIEEIRSLIAAGWLANSNLAQYEGDENWQPLSSMPEFGDSAPSIPAPRPVQAAIPQPILALKEPLDIARYLRIAFRVLLLLALLALIALGGLYVARHAKDIARKAGTIIPTRASASTNKPPIANAATTTPGPAADTAPVQTVRMVQLAAAPTNTTLAPWERATSPVSAASTITTASAATTPVVKAATNAATNAVTHRTLISKIDPKSTPFGEYDVRVIDTVQHQWFTLMEQNPSKGPRTGRVTVSFQLYRNGSVANVKVRESSGDGMEEYLCQQAVNSSQPFSRWPSNIATDYDSRELRFTFQY